MKFIPVLTLAAALGAASAHATTIDAKFSGVVLSQIGTGSAVSSPITGEFIYDTTLAAYTKFTIGGQSIASGYTSQADLTPDNYSALFTAQLSPVISGGSVNSTFSVDLEGLSTWTGGSAIGVLTGGQLPANLDTGASTFSYYMASASGTNVQSLTASLTSIQAAVPEPSAAALLLAGTAALGAAARRRV